MNSEIDISLASQDDLRAAQEFYDACDYGGAAIQVDDFVVLARSLGVIVGIGRLCNESGTLCLRGMQVHKTQRGSGVGSGMLRMLASQIGTRSCYCLPYTHLIRFYARVGFEPAADSAPSVLKQRLRQYQDSGRDITLMFRPGSS